MGKFNRNVSTNLLHMVIDCCMMAVAFLLATIIVGLSLGDSLRQYGPVGALFIMIFLLMNKDARSYNVTTFFYVDRTLINITKSFLIALVPVSLIVYDYVKKSDFDMWFYGSYVILSYVSVIISAFTVRYLATHAKINAPRVLLVGDIDRFDTFKKYLFKSNTTVKLIGYVSLEETGDERYLGSVKDLERIMFEELGSNKEYVEAFGNKHVMEVVRNMVGLAPETASEIFSKYINDNRLNVKQI
ncbi:MAG: hypothetical protein IJ427_08595, partial [Lachnospiraceae bacterium]|nr:hypothetical protein [Lachnospiraceae bacterium]